MSSCPAAQRRSLTAGKDCREVSRFEARCLMTDAIDASVPAMQQPFAHAALDLGLGKTSIEELFPSHHAMLSGSDLGDFLFRRPELRSHTDLKSAQP